MEKFEELSQEKQRRIIDAGMEVFGRYCGQGRHIQGVIILLFQGQEKLLYVSVSVLCNYRHKDAG